MDAVRQSHGLTTRVWYVMQDAVASTRAAMTTGMSRRRHVRPLDRPRAQQLESARLVEAEALFVQALCDDSNLELDWLWLSKQVVREHERRYCLERVLHINPHSEIAKAELKRLQPIPTHLRRMANYM